MTRLRRDSASRQVSGRMALLAGNALLLAALCTPGQASAETSRSFQVAAVIQSGCAVDGIGTSGSAGSIGSLSFGQDNTLSTGVHTAALSGSQTIILRCTPGVALTMTLDGGQHAAAGIRNLQLGSTATNRLQYRLYSDSGFTQEIGIGQSRSIAVTGSNLNNVQLPLFGRLTLPGTGQPGAHTDNILVTLNW